MDYIISKCCKAFCVNSKNLIICSNCGNIVGKIDGDNDITIGINYNSDSDMMKTINTVKSSMRIVKRLAKDKTCQLLDNTKCEKCGSKYRYYRNGDTTLLVCSNCRFVPGE